MTFGQRRFADSFQRTAIYSRDGGKCHYCGILLSFKDFHADHIIPWSKGGYTSLSNLVTSCYMCNVAKHDMSYSSYKSLLAIKGFDWRRRRYFAISSKFVH